MTCFGYISLSLPIVPVQGSAISTSVLVTPIPSTQCISIKGVESSKSTYMMGKVPARIAALICAVGDGMLESCGVSAKIFSAVADVGANVELISEGASDIALNFMVGGSKAVDVVRRLHELYIGA